MKMDLKFIANQSLLVSAFLLVLLTVSMVESQYGERDQDKYQNDPDYAEEMFGACSSTRVEADGPCEPQDLCTHWAMWNHNDAERWCPGACKKKGLKWTGNWRNTHVWPKCHGTICGCGAADDV